MIIDCCLCASFPLYVYFPPKNPYFPPKYYEEVTKIKRINAPQHNFPRGCAVSDNVFITYDDLASHGVRYTRVHLTRLMRKGLFPVAVRLSPNRIAWRLPEIEQWKANRPPAQVVQVDTAA